MSVWRALVAGILLVAIDQFAKFIFSGSASFVINQGFAFGLGESAGPWIFLALFLLLVIDSKRRGFGMAEVLIISGGAGNIIDRVLRGGVIDWIHLLDIWFNLGDVWIATGVTWIFLSCLRMTKSSL